MGLWDQRKLIYLAILKLLVPDVSADRLLVSAHRRNKIPARPEFVPGEVIRFSLDILRDPKLPSGEGRSLNIVCSIGFFVDEFPYEFSQCFDAVVGEGWRLAFGVIDPD